MALSRAAACAAEQLRLSCRCSMLCSGSALLPQLQLGRLGLASETAAITAPSRYFSSSSDGGRNVEGSCPSPSLDQTPRHSSPVAFHRQEQQQRRLWLLDLGARGFSTASSSGSGDGEDDYTDEAGAAEHLRGRVGEKVTVGEQQSEQGDADSPLLSKLHATDVRTVRHFGEDEGPFGSSAAIGEGEELEADDDEEDEEDDELDSTFEDFVYLAHNMGWANFARRVDLQERNRQIFFDNVAEEELEGEKEELPSGDVNAADLDAGDDADEEQAHDAAMPADFEEAWKKVH